VDIAELQSALERQGVFLRAQSHKVAASA